MSAKEGEHWAVVVLKHAPKEHHWFLWIVAAILGLIFVGAMKGEKR